MSSTIRLGYFYRTLPLMAAQRHGLHRGEVLAVGGPVAVLLGQAAGADLLTEAMQQVGERRFILSGRQRCGASGWTT